MASLDLPKLATAPFSAEKLKLSVEKVEVVTDSKLWSELEKSAFVFHPAFATGFKPDIKDDADYVIEKALEYFPRNFFVGDQFHAHLARRNLFTAKLGSALEHTSVLDSGLWVTEVVIGCGKAVEFNPTDAHDVAKILATKVLENNAKTLVIDAIKLKPDEVESLLVGVLSNLDVDARFKSSPPSTLKLEAIILLHNNEDLPPNFLEKCATVAGGVHLAKQLTNAPSNIANTISVTNLLEEKLTQLGLEVKILEEGELRELKMESYLSVGQGSKYPSRLIHATYTGEGDIKAKVALVGKGIMFDSGGYNVKNAQGIIHKMRLDMGGLASVFGAAQALATIKPKGVLVHFISCTSENMIDSNSYRPGDVVRASNGKTIEVVNTDAEGRMTLADALVYAEGLGVDYIIDLATLTGAGIIALGELYGGYFCQDIAMERRFESALAKTGELAWKLPLPRQYAQYLESKIADLANANYAVKFGTIYGGLFLKEFVCHTAWIHWDAAGALWDWLGKTDGPTGYGVKTLVQFVLDLVA